MVETTRYHALNETAQPYFYAPLRQRFGAGTGVALHVRATGAAEQATAGVRRELQAIDPAMPPPLMVTLVDYMGASYFAQRSAALLLGGPRGAGAGARLGRPLQPRVVRRVDAAAGDWRAHGARRRFV